MGTGKLCSSDTDLGPDDVETCCGGGGEAQVGELESLSLELP